MKPVYCQYILPNFSLESCTHWHFLRHCVRGSAVFILWKERLPCSRPHISLQKARVHTWPARLWGQCPLCSHGCLWLAPASHPLLVSTSPACFRPWRRWFSSSTWSQHRLLCLLWDIQETCIQRNNMKGLVGNKNTIPNAAGSGMGVAVYVLWIIKVFSHNIISIDIISILIWINKLLKKHFETIEEYWIYSNIYQRWKWVSDNIKILLLVLFDWIMELKS